MYSEPSCVVGAEMERVTLSKGEHGDGDRFEHVERIVHANKTHHIGNRKTGRQERRREDGHSIGWELHPSTTHMYGLPCRGSGETWQTPECPSGVHCTGSGRQLAGSGRQWQAACISPVASPCLPTSNHAMSDHSTTPHNIHTPSQPFDPSRSAVTSCRRRTFRSSYHPGLLHRHFSQRPTRPRVAPLRPPSKFRG